MEILAQVAQLRTWKKAQILSGKEVGFVPTMGALHEGHASLIRQAARENPAVAVSIFVNPTQFGPKEDLAKYPRTLQTDLDLCQKNGATMVYTPDSQGMYPPGFDTWVEVGKVGTHWCGAARPGHFRGVSTVVTKLFLQVQPDRVYFGQKDAQQAALLAKMTRELDFPIEFHLVPTMREADGLAMSSRNRYLSESDRAKATCLVRALEVGRDLALSGTRDCARIREKMQATVHQLAPEASVDYLGFAGSKEFEPLDEIQFPCTVLGAIRLGNTRLIDNLLVVGP